MVWLRGTRLSVDDASIPPKAPLPKCGRRRTFSAVGSGRFSRLLLDAKIQNAAAAQRYCPGPQESGWALNYKESWNPSSSSCAIRRGSHGYRACRSSRVQPHAMNTRNRANMSSNKNSKTFILDSQQRKSRNALSLAGGTSTARVCSAVALAP